MFMKSMLMLYIWIMMTVFITCLAVSGWSIYIGVTSMMNPVLDGKLVLVIIGCVLTLAITVYFIKYIFGVLKRLSNKIN